jgi:RNA polymerase sigma factor (sigma-70 family)
VLPHCESDVTSAQKGDKEAFVRLIKAAEQSMYRVARAILQSDDACADAIQESILKAYRSLGSLNQPSYYRTWLIRILINECSRMLKLNRRVIFLDTGANQPTTTATYDPIEIQEAIHSLEDEFRVVITLFYFEELSVKEIADALEVPEGTVKSRLSRARTKLAHLLGDLDERRVRHEHE